MERGRLKQRLSQVYRASLRSSCNISSRNVAEAFQEPVFVSRRYDGDDQVLRGLDRSLSLPPPTLESLLRRRGRHDVAAGSALPTSVDCSCRPTTATRESPRKTKKKERRVSEIGVFYEAGGDGEGRTCPPASPVSPSYYCFKRMKEELEREEKKLATRKKKEKDEKKKRKGKKLMSNSYGFTSSSSQGSDNDDVGDCFSSCDEGGVGAARDGPLLKERDRDTKVLFSSRSISSDSSDQFYYHTSRRHHSRKKTWRRQQRPRRGEGGSSRHWEGGFRPPVSVSSTASSSTYYAAATGRNEDAAAAMLMEEKVEVGREGFPVEKQSSDPYEDFRSSMLEMIVEKQMFRARELEHLLRCYLALNSPCHHPIIVQVFSEIWETLFSN